MSWYDALLPLGAIAKSLVNIEQHLARIADVHEGKLPNPTVVPEAEIEAPRIAPAKTDAEYARIEQIEFRYMALGGRLPTEEEICRELDGEEISDDEIRAAAAHLARDL